MRIAPWCSIVQVAKGTCPDFSKQRLQLDATRTEDNTRCITFTYRKTIRLNSGYLKALSATARECRFLPSVTCGHADESHISRAT